VITVVPSHGARAIYRDMRPYLSHRMVLVSATKGIENETLMRMSEVVWDELRDCFDPRFVVLSGPSFAVEVARGEPTAIVAASYREEWGRLVQRELSSGSFRIYTNTDVAGVELGGSVKNVIAIATGAVRGLGLGLNSVAAIVTRGLAEMTRLAVATGGRVETLAGLAGLGDLVLTCTGELSRNRSVGVELGRGRSLEEILAGTREVAEGVRTTRAVRALGRRLGIELPITEAVYSLLYEDCTPREVAEALMGRPLKRE
jgi:glycerol-3-phosphate dehydrogenase (NAD(P)+)